MDQPVPTQALESIRIGEYKLEMVIGQGSYGKVRLAHHVETNEKFAVKVIEKSKLKSQKQINRLQKEIRFLKLLYHPHIIKVYDVVETSDSIYIMMEYANGGELFDYIVANKRVKEKEARGFFRQVLSAVDYCHHNAVIHRDLKPENLLLDENKSIKIIDFGFGNNFSLDGKLLDTFCGSPFYAAPEMILGKKYEGPEVDMWSLGVILFALLCGYLPFDDEDIQKLYKKIAAGSYSCPDHVVPAAKHLIGRLITVDPKERATLKEVMCHPWVMESYQTIPPNYVPERQNITNVNDLSKDLIRRLYAFGYKDSDISEAFNETSDINHPNAVRSTYHLLREMLCREEVKQQRLANTRMNNSKHQSIDSSKRASSLDANSTVDQITSQVQNKLEISHPKAPQQKYPTPIQSTTNNSTIGPVVVIQAKDKIDMQVDGPSHLANDPRDCSPVSSNSNRSNSTFSDSPTYISEPNLFNGKRRSSAAKIRDDLKAVSGWFSSISTTSSRQPEHIMYEIKRVAISLGITFKVEHPGLVLCEVDMAQFIQPHSPNDTSNNKLNHIEGEEEGSGVSGKRLGVSFQIGIFNVSKSGQAQYSLTFKKTQGGAWNYKKVCNRMIELMEL